MIQWFVHVLQRAVEAGFRLLGALVAGIFRAPGVAAARAAAPIQVRRGTASEVVEVRHGVLREGRPRSTAVFEGDHDPGTRHWVAVQADRIVGVVSVMQAPLPDTSGASGASAGPAHQLRGMAVVPELRGSGLGATLLEATHAEGLPLWCNAREAVVPFYARYGWRPVGERFEIAGVGPHQRMVYDPG